MAGVLKDTVARRPGVLHLGPRGDLPKELRERVAAALRAVPGVTDVDEEDREVWIVDGQPSGEALVSAAARVLDDLAPRLPDFMDGLV